MKITRKQLLQITKEELQKVIAEAKISFKKTRKEIYGFFYFKALHIFFLYQLTSLLFH